MDPNHRKFLSHLEASRAAVQRAARWLTGKGYSVRIEGMRRAPERKDWQAYADSGDLTVEMRVEVKRLSRPFTSRKDWPFGSKFIVCAKHAWDRAEPKPYAIIVQNAEMTHAAIVKRETAGTWYVEKRTDSRYENVEQEFYFCPMDQVVFTSLQEPGAIQSELHQPAV